MPIPNSAENKSIMQTVNIQANAAQIQRQTFEGEAYITMPAVILTEGVHHGSRGPIFYPKEELAKFPMAWDGRPLPIDHPKDDNGTPISANSPAVLVKYSVGNAWETTFDEKLKTTLWLHERKVMTKAPKMLNTINNGGMVNLSTGLFFDLEETSGEWNGESYEGIARNLRPDHIALLPDTDGACSIEDGCGFPRVNEDANNTDGDRPKENKKEVPDMDNEKCCKERVATLIANEKSVYTEKDKEMLEGLKVEAFEALESGELARIEAEGKRDEAEGKLKEATANKAPENEGGDKKPEGADNTETPKAATPEEFLNNAPPEFKEMFGDSLKMYNERKAKLVTDLTANERCSFTKEQLEAKDITELEGLAKLARVPDYSGQGGGAVNSEPKEVEPMGMPTINDYVTNKN
jgi:hypothetical protein